MDVWRLFVSRDLGDREESVDAFRGLAIVGMILVNHPPAGGAIFPPLMHPAWTGWSLADTIFPAFLFIVGVSICLSIPKSDGKVHRKRRIFGRIVRRALLLIVLSILLINFPYYEFGTLKFTGTLSRIGIAYLLASLIYLYTGWRLQLLIAFSIIVVQWVVLAFLPVPEYGAGVITPEGNASNYLDLALFGDFASRLFLNDQTSEGVLVTLAGVATTLTGVLAGQWVAAHQNVPVRTSGMFAVGVCLLGLGSAWGSVLPISKPLWTGSYVVLTTGISLSLLALFYWVIEYVGYRAWAKPLEVAGVNALFFYVFAQSLQRVLVYGRLGSHGRDAIRLREYVAEQWALLWGRGEASSLLYSVTFLLVCYCAVAFLYRKRVFIKL